MSVDPAFERALVAASYLLGERDDAFQGWSLGAEARGILSALSAGDRQSRATVLAREIARIAVALDKSALA
jgi:hypothetical protein